MSRADRHHAAPSHWTARSRKRPVPRGGLSMRLERRKVGAAPKIREKVERPAVCTALWANAFGVKSLMCGFLLNEL